MKDLPVRTEADRNSSGADKATESTPRSRDPTPEASVWGADVRRLARWATKGGTAVLDQGLFSGANFLVNVLLARWLPPEEYGAFAVALSVFYLLAGFHTAVLTEPMLVFGAGRYREQFRKYLGMLLYGHWGLSALIALLLGVAALVMQSFGSKPMAQALAGLAIASPFLLLLWLTRRGCYVEMQPQWAVLGSGVNLVVTLAGLFLLWRAGLLSSLSGLVLLGAAAAIASLVLLVLCLRPRVWGFAGNPTPAIVLADHWRYGSWNWLGVTAYWASSHVLAVLIPIFLGLAASAVVVAIGNIFRPINLLIQSLTLVLLPKFSRLARQNEGGDSWKQFVLNVALIFASGVGLFGLVVSIFGQAILHSLYMDKYNQYWPLIIYFALTTSTSAAIQVFTLALKARGEVQHIPVIWGGPAAVLVVSSIPLMVVAGLNGVMLSMVASYLIALWMAWRRLG